MRTDFLLLADAAQVAEGKLFLMGGAWNRLQLPHLPAVAPVAIAVGFMVGWEETNVPFKPSLTIEDEDGRIVLGPLDLVFEMGRPAGYKPGEDQRVVMAVNGQVNFDRAGGYAVVVRHEGNETARASFRVVGAT